jgi:hypothetical protein
MEMRRENTIEKRKRKLISKGPVLVRSVKPGQSSTLSWQRESSSPASFWRN